MSSLSSTQYKWPSLAGDGIGVAGAAVVGAAPTSHESYEAYLRAWLEVYDRTSSTASPHKPHPVPGAAPTPFEAVRRLNAELIGQSSTKSNHEASTDGTHAEHGPRPIITMHDMMQCISSAGDGSRAPLPAPWVTPPPMEATSGRTVAPAKAWTDCLHATLRWISSGVSAAEEPCPPFSTQGLAQCALEHVMLAAPLQPEVLHADGVHSRGHSSAAAAGEAAFSEWGDASLLTDPRRYSCAVLLGETKDGLSEHQAGEGFRASLVVLLFHRHPAIRVWARERLLDCIYSASTGRPRHAGDGGEAEVAQWRLQSLWVFASQLLCVLKHLSHARLPVVQHKADGSHTTRTPSETSPSLLGEAVYHMCVVLADLDERLTAATTAVGTLAVKPPSSAIALLLGGTILFNWIGKSIEEMADLYRAQKTSPRARSGAEAVSAISNNTSCCYRTGSAGQQQQNHSTRRLQRATGDVFCRFNYQIRHDQTLQRVKLAVGAQKAAVKILVHGVLDSIKAEAAVGDCDSQGSATIARSGARMARLRLFWAISSVLDAPPSSVQQPTVNPYVPTGSLGGAAVAACGEADAAAATGAPEATKAKCLGWMLEPLMKNAAVQLGMSAVLQDAAKMPSNLQSVSSKVAEKQSFGGSGGCGGLRPYVRPGSSQTPVPTSVAAEAAGNDESGCAEVKRQARIRRVVVAYRLLLETLLATVPALASSPVLHATLVEIQKTLASLAAGAALHLVSADAAWLFALLMRVDLLAFSTRPETDPTSGVAALNTVTSSKHQPSACLDRVWDNYSTVIRLVVRLRPAANGSSSITVSTLVVHLFEALYVLVAEPLVDRWLLMLPDLDRGGPSPLSWKVKRVLDGLLEVLRTQAGELRQKWLAADGVADHTSAVSRLLASHPAVIRLVHVLAYAQSPQLRDLGQRLSDVFLRDVSPSVHETFATDAAEWLWVQVILPNPLLLGTFALDREDDEVVRVTADGSSRSVNPGPHWLQLHDTKVDNLARCWGTTWIPVLTHCNWSSEEIAESPVYVASAWWMAALIADVVPLDHPQDRYKFIEHVVTQLPSPSSPGDEVSKSVTAIPSEEALYQVVRQLLLSLLEKHALYQAPQLVAAVLYVAGALPRTRVEVDTELTTSVKAHLVRMSRYLLLPQAVAATSKNAGSHNTGGSSSSSETVSPAVPLLQYGPPWLIKAAQQATMAVDECLADQERRLKQFEWEEDAAQLEEAHTTRRRAEDVARMVAAEAMRKRRLQQEMERNREASAAVDLAALNTQVQPAASFEAGGGDRCNTGNGGEGQAIEITAMSRDDFVQHHGKRPDPFNDDMAQGPAADKLSTPEPTLSQLKRQRADEFFLKSLYRVSTETDICTQLQRIVGYTNVLRQPPATDDIIGTGPTCLALEVPVLPEIFVSRTDPRDTRSLRFLSTTEVRANHVAAATYSLSFIPHIALELRYNVCKDFEEIVDFARSGFDGRHQWQRQRGYEQAAAAGTESGGNLHSVVTDTNGTLSQAFPLSPWIKENSLSANYVSPDSSRVDPLDPSRIDVTVTVRRSGKVSGPLLSQNDIVLVLLPLEVVLPAWFNYLLERHSNGQSVEERPSVEKLIAMIPEPWKDLGCFPQVCYVSSVFFPAQQWTLTTYPLHGQQSSTRSGTGRSGGSSSRHNRHREPPPIPFLHALRLGFRASNSQPHRTFFVKRMGTLWQAVNSVHALFGMYKTKYMDTLNDPQETAADSKTYYESFNRFLAQAPDAIRQMRARLLLQRTVNDGQVKAIAAALYAVTPRWDEGPVLSSDAGLVGNIPLSYHTGNGAGDTDSSQYGSLLTSVSATPRFLSGKIPDILIIEGPPGTGKTQTVSLLVLNLLIHVSSGGRVLVCAPSNCAVDEALMRVRNQQDVMKKLDKDRGPSGQANTKAAEASVLRVGVRDNVDGAVLDLVPPVFLDDVVESELQRDGLGGQREDNTAYATMMERKHLLLASCRIVFSTLGSLSQLQRLNSSFDVVIVDEASQATEPEIAQALVLANKCCILVGDSQQLQPTILCREAASCGLKRSLMVRLLSNGHCSFMLRTQFRMHRDICYFPNRRYYGGKLLTDSSVERRQLPPDVASAGTKTIAQKLCGMARCVFVDVPTGVMVRAYGHTLKNDNEAEAVVAYIRQLRAYLHLSAEELAEHVGIITFYRGQCRAIMQRLSKEERKSGLLVATVDSFQGKEKSIILISCVRTADETRLQLLKDMPNRLRKHVYEDSSDDDAGSCPSGRRITPEERAEKGRAVLMSADIINVDAMESDEESEMVDVDDSSQSASSSSKDDKAVSAYRVPQPKRPRVEDRRSLMEEGIDAALQMYDAVGGQTLGFVVDRHRVNVALTRAKELCIVLGHAQTFSAVAEAEAVALQLHTQLHQRRARAGASESDERDASPSVEGALIRDDDASDRSPGGLAMAPTTVDSSKEAVRAKLRIDDEDPFALAALVKHARAGGSTIAGEVTAAPVAAANLDDLIETLEAPTNATLCTYPGDGRLIDQLRLGGNRRKNW